ncbi:hypothetical protein HID58_057766 [Brassica napus]|uniref:Uncharacterized protein n=1 Tax=Brassica napus TaxID=3708 RepID=A0ABQ7XHX3_BRANA|nr:hypothetical protein HID58_057766 [Brassica napus]
MTPIHDSAATARRPQTPENRTMTAQHRDGGSPEFMARSPGAKVPDPSPCSLSLSYFEPLSRTPKQRSKTPEPSPRIPQTHPYPTDPLTVQLFKRPGAKTRPYANDSRQKTAVQKGKVT